MLGGDDLLFNEIFDYCNQDYKLMKKLLDYFYSRLKEEMERSD